MSREIEQIKDRLDIVDLIGSYIKLDKAGRNYKARCPFHSEKTPSFIISPERQSFYCFGCQAKGDIFSFVEKFEGLEFKEALKILATRAGVELKSYKKENIEKESKKERLLKVLEEASRVYERFLKNDSPQMRYLQERGISGESVKKWRIGWAPLEWRTILNELGVNFRESELSEAGLVKRTEDGKKTYDVFRGRIMFPIFDISGRIIAFSGRLFIPQGASLVPKEPPWEIAPKYVNTPETEIFKKSDILYGLNFAKSEIRRLDYSVLVEGQVDLILSYQAGVKNTVASSGTALTESHLRQLQKLSSRCIIAYDSDDAGRAAARKSAELALMLGMEVKVASLSEGEDPASIIVKSQKQWKDMLKLSVNLIEFTIDEAVRKNNKKSELIKELNKSVIPLLSSVQSEMLRSEMVSLVSRKTKISERSIWADLENFSLKSEFAYKKFRPQDDAQMTSIEPIVLSLEEVLAGITLLGNDNIKEKLKELVGEEVYSDMVENGRLDKETLIFETEARLKDLNMQKVGQELIARIEKRILEKKLFDIARQLDLATTLDLKEKLKKEAVEVSSRLAHINK